MKKLLIKTSLLLSMAYKSDAHCQFFTKQPILQSECKAIKAKFENSIEIHQIQQTWMACMDFLEMTYQCCPEGFLLPECYQFQSLLLENIGSIAKASFSPDKDPSNFKRNILESLKTFLYGLTPKDCEIADDNDKKLILLYEAVSIITLKSLQDSDLLREFFKSKFESLIESEAYFDDSKSMGSCEEALTPAGFLTIGSSDRLSDSTPGRRIIIDGEEV